MKFSTLIERTAYVIPRKMFEISHNKKRYVITIEMAKKGKKKKKGGKK